MIFAFMADIHLSRYSQDKLEDTSRLPERLHSIKNSIYEVAQYCVKNSIDTIIIGGDTLHGKSIIYAIAQDIMLQYFKDFPKIQFYVIDGNHDLSGKGDDVVSALRPLETISNVKWISFKDTMVLHDQGMVFLPYSNRLPELVKEFKYNILISHFGLSEGILNSGMSIVSDIGLKDLTGRYKLVLLGHYHKPQEIIREGFQLYYVGSSVQLDWGEKNDEKRFLIVDSDTLKVQSIPLTSYKKHIELTIDKDNIIQSLELAQKARDEGHHIQLIAEDKIDTTIFKDFKVIDKTTIDITDRGITSSMSQADKFRKYLEIKGITEIDDYMKEAMDIVHSCEG